MSFSSMCLFILHASMSFSLPVGVRDWLRLMIAALPGRSYLVFLHYYRSAARDILCIYKLAECTVSRILKRFWQATSQITTHFSKYVARMVN